MKDIMKPDDEIGNPIPVKQAKDFFTRHTVEYFIRLDTKY
jgi:hypothetical protein